MAAGTMETGIRVEQHDGTCGGCGGKARLSGPACVDCKGTGKQPCAVCDEADDEGFVLHGPGRPIYVCGDESCIGNRVIDLCALSAERARDKTFTTATTPKGSGGDGQTTRPGEDPPPDSAAGPAPTDVPEGWARAPHEVWWEGFVAWQHESGAVVWKLEDHDDSEWCFASDAASPMHGDRPSDEQGEAPPMPTDRGEAMRLALELRKGKDNDASP